MNIQSFKTEGVALPPKPTARAAKPAKETPADEAPQATPTREKLVAALQNEPDVRPEEVARGKALASDPNYPSKDLLSKLAGIFVDGADAEE